MARARNLTRPTFERRRSRRLGSHTDPARPVPSSRTTRWQLPATSDVDLRIGRVRADAPRPAQSNWRVNGTRRMRPGHARPDATRDRLAGIPGAGMPITRERHRRGIARIPVQSHLHELPIALVPRTATSCRCSSRRASTAARRTRSLRQDDHVLGRAQPSDAGARRVSSRACRRARRRDRGGLGSDRHRAPVVALGVQIGRGQPAVSGTRIRRSEHPGPLANQAVR